MKWSFLKENYFFKQVVFYDDLYESKTLLYTNDELILIDNTNGSIKSAKIIKDLIQLIKNPIIENKTDDIPKIERQAKAKNKTIINSVNTYSIGVTNNRIIFSDFFNIYALDNKKINQINKLRKPIDKITIGNDIIVFNDSTGMVFCINDEGKDIWSRIPGFLNSSLFFNPIVTDNAVIIILKQKSDNDCMILEYVSKLTGNLISKSSFKEYFYALAQSEDELFLLSKNRLVRLNLNNMISQIVEYEINDQYEYFIYSNDLLVFFKKGTSETTDVVSLYESNMNCLYTYLSVKFVAKGIEPLADDNLLFINSEDSKIIALDISESGKVFQIEKWKKEIKGTALHSFITSRKHLFFLTSENQIYAIDKKNGNLLWNTYYQGRALTKPVFLDDQLFFISLRESYDGDNVFLNCINALNGSCIWEAILN